MLIESGKPQANAYSPIVIADNRSGMHCVTSDEYFRLPGG